MISPEDLVTASEAAPLLGVATSAAARDKMRRLGYHPSGIRSQQGENLYRRTDVEHVIEHAPGRGTRTDLHTPGDHMATTPEPESELEYMRGMLRSEEAAFAELNEWSRRAQREYEEAEEAWSQQDCPASDETAYQMLRASVWADRCADRARSKVRQIGELESHIARLDPEMRNI